MVSVDCAPARLSDLQHVWAGGDAGVYQCVCCGVGAVGLEEGLFRVATAAEPTGELVAGGVFSFGVVVTRQAGDDGATF